MQTTPKDVQGPLTHAKTRRREQYLAEIRRSKQVFEDILYDSVKSLPLSSRRLLHVTVCFCWVRDGVGGLYYIWHIHAWKWFCALLTHRLKRLIDCGSWLTLERRQPVSLTFTFTLGSFIYLFFFLLVSEEVKRKMYDLTWESREEGGTWPHLQHNAPKTKQQLVTLWESLSSLNRFLHTVTSGLK